MPKFHLEIELTRSPESLMEHVHAIEFRTIEVNLCCPGSPVKPFWYNIKDFIPDIDEMYEVKIQKIQEVI